ncbi:MAG: winged-helix domain-containing protein, partial [Trebonia sp.]
MSSVAELPNPSDEPGSPGQAASGTSATVEVGVGGRLRHASDGEPAPSDQLDGQADRPYPGGIPDATVARLPIYLRALYTLADRGVSTVASDELAAAAGVNSAKLRKDLSHLGSYGIRGVGYDVEYLVYQVSRALGLN